ncbi:MAG: hypothetical protein CMO55_17235 [Verrucomicrobiales bacterium]|nr:hypothetical protein [Verrucomicrobiales bacterium]
MNPSSNESAVSWVDKYEFTKDWFSNRESDWWESFGYLSAGTVHAMEIGSLEGRSAMWMLEHLLVQQESTLTCIDLFSNPVVEARFDTNLQASGKAHKVTKLSGPSWTHLRNLRPGQFDLIYIDGSHHGRDVLEDGVLSFRLVKPGGFLIFDDYPWRNEDHSVYPKDAIDAFLYLYRDDVRVLQKKWQVFLQKM